MRITILFIIVLLIFSQPFKSSASTQARNIIQVLVNADDQILFEGELLTLDQICDTLVRIMDVDQNDDNSLNYPGWKLQEIDSLGEVRVSLAVIHLAVDNGTSYDFYIKLMDEFVCAYDQLRNRAALKHFNTPYADLPKSKQKLIWKVYPKRISEAEPVAPPPTPKR